ncbi:MAG: hypothetical protein JWO69_505 [Thermoleophilia bacterium]|nr:hypothetical protein [Thermoleophilia bacterium]
MTLPTPCLATRARTSAAGFTVVEVIIAVLLLTVAMTAVGMAAMSTSSARGSARLQSALTGAGVRAQEDVASDRTWMSTCVMGVAECDVAGVLSTEALKLDDVDGVATVFSAKAEPLDSEVDGVGERDADGVTPDFYRVTIVIEPSQALQARYRLPANKARRTFVTTIDRKGREQVGAVSVEICQVVNQADERSTIQGCAPAGRTDNRMAGCSPQPRAGCNEAFSWVAALAASDADRSPFMSLRRLSAAGVTLQNVSTGARYGSPKIVDGVAVFQNVPAGEVRVLGASPPSGFERWGSKEIPASHGGSAASMVVEPGLKNRALALFRPMRSPSGINLYFERKTKTYRLNGPRSSTQVAVPEMAPTQGYQGASAEEYCARYRQIDNAIGAEINCVGVFPDGVNCVRVHLTGVTYAHVGVGGGSWSREALGALGVSLWSEVGPGLGDYNQVAVNDPSGVRACTYYAEYYHHTYYGGVTDPPYQTRVGAAAAAKYYLEPKPDVRHVESGPAGPTAPTPSCTVQQRWQQCSGDATPLSGSLARGLHSELLAPDSDKDAVSLNQRFSSMPAWLGNPAASPRRGIWVRPDGGGIDGADGTRRAFGSRVTLTGLGECYWLGPNIGREAIGSCGVCNPLWKVGWEYKGACSILTATRWERPAWETVFAKNLATGLAHPPYTSPIEGQSGTISYNPPWACFSAAPRTGRGGSCKSMSFGGGGNGGGKKIPTTRHKDSSGGSGVVDEVSFTDASF